MSGHMMMTLTLQNTQKATLNAAQIWPIKMGYITSAYKVSVTEYRPVYGLAKDVSSSDYKSPQRRMIGWVVNNEM